MTSIADMKIGKKLALILGGNVLLLASLSVLSLWGIRASERLAEESIGSLKKSKLSERVAGQTAGIAQNMAKMIMAKATSDETVSEVVELRKTVASALEEFKSAANDPKAAKQATDMAELVQSAQNNYDSIMAFLAAGRPSDAVKDFRDASAVSGKLHAAAKEASLWQEQLAADNERKRQSTSRTIWIVLIGGCLLSTAAALAGGIVLTRGIATPLAQAVEHMNQIAQGDLSKDAPAEFQARGDEIGTLARAKQTMIVALRKMVQDISGGIEVLTSSSAGLMTSSTEMTSGSRHASDKAHAVSAAAEEMSANISSVAQGMEHASTNLAQVASATEQMTSTIGEIAQNSEKARTITDEATRQAARITEQINQLGAAAREIGKVTEAITEISSQTNLLALNATIEAARAGTAGKGFAVVATEIKALAQQTATATEDIKRRIAGVQAATAGGIAEVGKVSQVILEVSSIVASIAAAIDQQAGMTKGIARNIAEASSDVSDANSRVSETSQVSREIAKDIVSVDRSARDMASGSEHVRVNAGELSTVAENLRATVGRFHAVGLAKVG